MERKNTSITTTAGENEEIFVLCLLLIIFNMISQQ